MKTFRTQTRVRYAETDATGIAYYNSYLVYFEVGRIEMFRDLGLTYDWRLPIRETHCRYHASAEFDDVIEIETFVEEVRTKAFRLGSRALCVRPEQEPQLLAEGYTVMVTLDDQGQPSPMPPEFRTALTEASTGS
ncbi:MAG: acyl-CoA thioesterase [Deltaproteobacteria bacterium]|jgi:acyl-CoA thioester hydrolase|nr:acyl-CoA thioesterase [Deltaproteobacteria bacterium]MBW2533707.1 acyl-CoA thioesterase [Deltaproteobacteria bacterium]